MMNRKREQNGERIESIPDGRDVHGSRPSSLPIFSSNIPGAHHVPGTHSQINSPQELRRPYSGDFESDIYHIGADQVVVLDETVFDGDIVPPQVMPVKRDLFFCLILCACNLVIFVSVINFSDLKENQIRSSEMPKASPLNSPSPTTSCINNIKNILIPLSGEAVFNDIASPQYFSWKHLVKMEEISDENTCENEKEIVQKYLGLVLPLSTFGGVDYNKIWSPKQPYRSACDIYTCNEAGEIIYFVLQNNMSTEKSNGVFAKEIGEMSALTHVVLRRNNVQGTIPTEIGNLENLRVLDLSGNKFRGTIPTELGRLKKLEMLILSGNMLDGHIPNELGNSQNLRYIDISHNNLFGSVPPEIGEIGGLLSASLQRNNFSGDINFFCKKNYTEEIIEEDLNIGLTMDIEHRISYKFQLSIIVDCQSTAPNLTCDCCVCV